MNAIAKKCPDAFEQGRTQRLPHPLPSGLYKLRESKDWLESELDGVERIAAFQRGRIDRRQLTHCTPDDAALWLRELPAYIAHGLAYNVLPAIDALIADDVAQDVVTELKNVASQQAALLVRRLEAVRISISGRIKSEYDRMKMGDSMISPVIEDTLALIDLALRQVPQP